MWESVNEMPQIFEKSWPNARIEKWSKCILYGIFSGDKPTYAQIAEWRKILYRLSSFLKSVDYLVLEMLRRLVVTATKHLLDHLVSAYNVTEEEEMKVQLDDFTFSS